jgi:hypothetical protein
MTGQRVVPGGGTRRSAMTQNQDGSNRQDQLRGASMQQPGAGSAESGQQRQFEQRSEQMGGGGQGDDSRFADQIREHMQVIDADGNEVGMVDACEGGRIKLTRADSPDGEHRYLQLSEVESVEGDQVRLRSGGNSSSDAGFGQGV